MKMNKLLIIMFLGVIFLIFGLNIIKNNTTQLIASSIDETKNSSYDNTQQEVKSLISNFENKYNESIPGKKTLAKITNVLDYKLFHKIDSRATLMGTNNWLFYKTDYDGNPIEDYKGSNLYTDEQIKDIVKNVKNVQDKFNSENIKFYIMIPSNKEQIYSQYMPPDIEVINKEKKADILLKKLKENGINTLDPKEELLKFKDSANLYYRNDTHWNNLGAFIATQHINSAILGRREEFDVNNVVDQGIAKKCDLLNILELSNYNDDVEYNYLCENNDTKVEYQLINENIDSYKSNAQNKQNVFVIGDSFRLALEEWLPKYYSTVNFIHRNDFKPDLIKEIKPDVVIYEIVERHTDDLSKYIY